MNGLFVMPVSIKKSNCNKISMQVLNVIEHVKGRRGNGVYVSINIHPNVVKTRSIN